MKNCNLCVILDREALGKRNIVSAAKAALQGGADIIQYRDKVSCDKEFTETAMALQEIVRKSGGTFIVNDRVHAAALINADGVHVGQEDMPARCVREYLRGCIVGVSARNTEQAVRAEKDGADYIGVGPVFRSPNKPHIKPVGPMALRRIKKNVNIPLMAIGGINMKNIALLKRAGIEGVAVISAATNSGNICAAVSGLKHKLKNSDLESRVR